jgi:hypothetical protein
VAYSSCRKNVNVSVHHSAPDIFHAHFQTDISGQKYQIIAAHETLMKTNHFRPIVSRIIAVFRAFGRTQRTER